jgi:sodium transport system ATP-binding protein
MPQVIEVTGLNKVFTLKNKNGKQSLLAVNQVSFAAANGKILGLLGANGAGKTTTLRMIAGLIKPDSGAIQVDGVDAVANSHGALKRLGMLSDARGLYPRLTARENILYYAGLHGVPDAIAQGRLIELARLFGIHDLLERRTEGFSLGERMKTALARALIHEPANVILDEPTNGLDVTSIRALRECLLLLRERGICLIISTHIMQEVERLCDDVVVMARGSTVAHGSVAQLLEQAKTQDFEEAFVRLAAL